MKAISTAFALVAMALSPLVSWAAQPARACALLTLAQISAVVGVQFGPGSEFGRDGRTCHWQQLGKTAGGLALTLRILDPRTFESGKSTMPIGGELKLDPVKDWGTMPISTGDLPDLRSSCA